MKLGPVVQEMLFKEQVYGRMDDGQRPITIAHLEPSAQVSLKNMVTPDFVLSSKS